MDKFLTYAVALAPDLIMFAKSLYDAFDGDIEKSRQNIEDRREQIAWMRSKRDAALKIKHGGMP